MSLTVVLPVLLIAAVAFVLRTLVHVGSRARRRRRPLLAVTPVREAAFGVCHGDDAAAHFGNEAMRR